MEISSEEAAPATSGGTRTALQTPAIAAAAASAEPEVEDGIRLICAPDEPQPRPSPAQQFAQALEDAAKMATQVGLDTVSKAMRNDEARCIEAAKRATQPLRQDDRQLLQYPRGAKACEAVAAALETTLNDALCTIEHRADTLEPATADAFMQQLILAAEAHKVPTRHSKRQFRNRAFKRLIEEREKFEQLKNACGSSPTDTQCQNAAVAALKVWRAHHRWRDFGLDSHQQVVEALTKVHSQLEKQISQRAEKLKDRLEQRRVAFARSSYHRNPSREKARLLDGEARTAPVLSAATCESQFRSDYQRPADPTMTLLETATQALAAALLKDGRAHEDALTEASLLLGITATVGTTQQEEPQRVSIKDVQAIVTRLDSRKGCRGDFPNTLLKALAARDRLANAVAYVLSTWLEHGIPEGYNHFVTTLVRKPDRPEGQPNSWRKISQPRIWANLFQRIVLGRLSPWLEDLLPPEMMGFRKYSDGCTHLVTKMRLWMLGAGEPEDSRSQRQDRRAPRHHHVLVTDMRSAFDCMERERLLQALRRWGVHATLQRAVASIMTTGHTEVVAADGLSPPIPLDGFAVQGSALTPLLFNCYLAETVLYMRTIGNSFARTPAGGPSDFVMGLYADDCIVGMRDEAGLEVVLKTMHACLKHLNIALNSDKSYFVSTSDNSMRVRLAAGVEITSRKLTEPLTYLGTPLLVCGDRDGMRWPELQSRADQMEVKRLFSREVSAIGATPWSVLQKLDAVKTRLYAKLVYLFRVCWLPPAFLKKLDSSLRTSLKEWLLYKNLGTACIQARLGAGGLQLRSLEDLYASVTATCIPSLAHSKDLFLRDWFRTTLERYATTLQERRGRSLSTASQPDEPSQDEQEPDNTEELANRIGETEAAEQLNELRGRNPTVGNEVDEERDWDEDPLPADSHPLSSVAEASEAGEMRRTVPRPIRKQQFPQPSTPSQACVLDVVPEQMEGTRYNNKRPYEAKLLAGLRQYSKSGFGFDSSFEFNQTQKAISARLKDQFFNTADFDFGCMAQGQAAAVCSSSPANTCLQNNYSRLRDYQVIDGLKARTFGLQCGSIRDRNKSGSIYCPHCHPTLRTESQGHLLGGCPATRATAILRHNKVVDLLHKDLRSCLKDSEVVQSALSISSQSLVISDLITEYMTEARQTRADGTLETQLRALKHFAPDIIIIRKDESDNKWCFLLDVTICSCDDDLIAKRTEQKMQRYQPMADWLRRKLNAMSSTVVPIVLTSNGLATAGAQAGIELVLPRQTTEPYRRKTACWILKHALEQVVIPYINTLARMSQTRSTSGSTTATRGTQQRHT